MKTLPDYLVMFIMTYITIGVLVICFVPAVLRLMDEVGRKLPEEHVRYVTLMFLAWPLIYWVYRHYTVKMQRAARKKEFGELRDLIARATKAAKGDEQHGVQSGYPNTAQ